MYNCTNLFVNNNFYNILNFQEKLNENDNFR